MKPLPSATMISSNFRAHFICKTSRVWWTFRLRKLHNLKSTSGLHATQPGANSFITEALAVKHKKWLRYIRTRGLRELVVKC